MIPLIFAGVFLALDIAMFVRMIYLLRAHRDDVVENLGNKLTPYLYAIGACSILMAICTIIVTVVG